MAPSTLNSQPWLFKISDDSCEVYLDQSIRLIASDPYEKWKYISVGCFLETLEIASRYLNVFSHISMYTNDGPLIAKLYFKDLDKKMAFNPEYESLFKAIKARRTHRSPFLNQKIDKSCLSKWKSISQYKGIETHWIEDRSSTQKFLGICREGLRAAHANKEWRREVSGWLNPLFSSKKRGIHVSGLGVSKWLMPVIPNCIKYLNLGKPISYKIYRNLMTAPLHSIICSQLDRPEDWVNAGKQAQRVILQIVSDGYQVSISVAGLSTRRFYDKTKHLLGGEDNPQFFFVVGKAINEQPQANRFSTHSKLAD